MSKWKVKNRELSSESDKKQSVIHTPHTYHSGLLLLGQAVRNGYIRK